MAAGRADLLAGLRPLRVVLIDGKVQPEVGRLAGFARQMDAALLFNLGDEA
jgi:hypothetical protein